MTNNPWSYSLLLFAAIYTSIMITLTFTSQEEYYTRSINNGCYEDEVSWITPDGYKCLPVDNIPAEVLKESRWAE